MLKIMEVVLLSLIGSLIILDKLAFGEFGFSQPIIAGTIIGAFFGDIWFGIFLGAIIQLIFLGGLPIGRDIPPDGQAAGIIGVGSYFLIKISNSLGHALLLAVILALLGGIIGGAMEIYVRRFNERLYRQFMKREDWLYRCHFAGLITAFLRGFCLFLPIFIFAGLFIIPDTFPQLTKELLVIIGIGAGLSNAFYLFMKKSTMIYFLLGGLCGLVLVVL